MKYPIHKLLLLAGSIALALPFSSCRQHIDEVDGMAKKGFYNAPRQVYFQRVTSDVPCRTILMVVQSFVPRGS